VSFRFAGHASSSSLPNGAANGSQPPSASALIESYSMVSPMATRRPPSSLGQSDGGAGATTDDPSFFGNNSSNGSRNKNNNSGRSSAQNSSRLPPNSNNGGYDTSTKFPSDMSLRGAARSAEGDDQATGRYANVIGGTQVSCPSCFVFCSFLGGCALSGNYLPDSFF